jgi:hypothetical protein
MNITQKLVEAGIELRAMHVARISRPAETGGASNMEREAIVVRFLVP